MKVLKLNEAKELSSGVFWDIDGELLAFPFNYNTFTNGIAKSGDTYNHKKLWPDIKPRHCNKTYNYYPRGRVVVDKLGRSTIYMNPNVDNNLLKDIKTKFGILDEPKICYDNSEHYKCYLDAGWKKDN